MNALVEFVDAALRGGTPAMSDLDQVIERALRLAAPALGRVAVSFNKPHRIDVRNHGTALECLISGPIIELARSGARTQDPTHRQQIDDVFADVGRGTTVLEIESSGLPPNADSWRIALASDLAARIGASFTTPPASAGFVVHLDSSSIAGPTVSPPPGGWRAGPALSFLAPGLARTVEKRGLTRVVIFSRPCLRACVVVVARLLVSACHEGPLLGRPRLASGAGRQDRTLRRQHLVRRGPLGGGHAHHRRRRHRHPTPRQGADPAKARPGHAAHLLISHTHWDHIQGLPFFAPLYQRGNSCPSTPASATTSTCGRCSRRRRDDPYFPVRSRKPRPRSIRELTDSAKFEIADVQVACTRLNHPYIATAYRLTVDGASVAYVSDTAPFSDILFENQFVARPPRRAPQRPRATAQKLRAHARGRGAAVRGRRSGHLRHHVHARRLPRIPHYGHSRPKDAIEICRRGGGVDAWRCSTTRPSAPTTRSTPSSPHTRATAADGEAARDRRRRTRDLEGELGRR